MGILAILSLAVGAASGITQYKAAKTTAKARKEANKISSANETIKNRLANRQQAKRARIVRGRLAQSAANTGVSGSSGELGAVSGISSSAGASFAGQQTNILAAQGISAQSQRAASAQSKANAFSSFATIFDLGVNFAEEQLSSDD